MLHSYQTSKLAQTRVRCSLLALALAAFAVLVPPASAATTKALTPPRKVVTVEGVTEYRLDNGLRLLLYPDPSAARFTVNMTVLVGSRYEGYGEAGMAHLLEHMLFKGTPTYPSCDKLFRERGVSPNATTTQDRTYYYETLPANDANVEFAIRFEADRLVNCFVRRDDLVSEMTVVRNEFESNENNPLTILGQRLRAAAFDWHNYGKTTMGNRSDIERVPIDHLQAFYRKYYQPDNVVLIITGKFDEAKTLELVARYFGALARPSRHLDQSYTEEPPQDGERNIVLRRVGSLGAVAVAYHIPSSCHEDFQAIEVLQALLTTASTGRLYGPLVKSKKADEIAGSVFEGHDPSLLELYAVVDAKKSVEQTRDAMIEVVEGVAATPITEQEVERVKRDSAQSFEIIRANSKQMAVELSSCAGRGDWRLLFLDRDRMAKVTAADVTRVARRYLRRNNRTVALFIPTQEAERVAIPSAPPAAELVKDYRGKTMVSDGESFDPTLENLEKRVQRAVLPSGVKVALLPKKTRGHTVTAQLTLRFGNERSLHDNLTAARFLGALMLRGTKERNRQQIVEDLTKLGATIWVGSSRGVLTFTIASKRESFPAVLHILREILRQPAFPESELELLKRQQKLALEQARTDPDSLAAVLRERKLSPYPKSDIRYQPGIEEIIAEVDALKVDQIRNLYTEQLGGQEGEFAAVGDFDPANTRELLVEMLKDWKTTVPYERLRGADRTDVAPCRQDIITPDKANAVYYAGQLLTLRAGDPDYVAMLVANQVFGDGSGSRLWTRIREKEGLSYTVESKISVSDLDPVGSFTLYAICNPKNIDKVDRAVAEELKRLVAGGISDEELASAKKSLTQELALSRANDSAVVRVLASDVRSGRTFAFYAGQERKLAQLTTADVNRAIRQHIAPERLVIIRAGDFKNVSVSTKK